jgi:hypothetical protein
LLKDNQGDLPADSLNILSKIKNYFLQLLNIHRISDVGQREKHTAEMLVPDICPFGVEIAIEK